MKNDTRIRRPAIALLVSFVFLSGCDKQGPSSPPPPAASAPTVAAASSASADQRLGQLEHEIQQLQDQIKQLAQQNKDKEAAAAPSSATASAPTPGSQASAPPSVEPSPQPAPDSDAGQVKLVHGWIARIMPVGADASEVPSDELGRFIAANDSYRISDFAKETHIRSGVDVGWKGEAYLEATEGGHYTFSINFIRNVEPEYYRGTGAPDELTCWGSLSLEGHAVAQGATFVGAPVIRSVIGGADLPVGRYRVEFWVACGSPMEGNGVAAPANGQILYQAVNMKFEVMVKRPSDSEPLSAAKAFVIKEVPARPDGGSRANPPGHKRH